MKPTLMLLLVLAGQDPEPRPPSKYPEAQAHRPTPLPDRIILTWKTDPARSQAVTWRTDTTVERAVAQIARPTVDSQFVRAATTVEAETTPFRSDLGDAHYHSVNFTELEPDTRYVYRVGDGVNWSEWIHFRTAADRPSPFSFIYFGDAQNEVKQHWSRVIREAYSDAPKARFIVHAGDLINRANRDAEWGEWFQAGGWVNAMIPSIPTPGNHEYETILPGNKGGLSRHWRPQFTLPDHGPDGLDETVYFIDYQGVRVISLNTNEKRAEQVPWLERVLADNPNRWTVVTFHHPMYSPAKGRDNPQLRELWQPVLDKYRVDLVLTGHDHTYGRSGLLTVADRFKPEEKNEAAGVSRRDPNTGTVYVVSVSGPKMYRLDPSPWMIKSAENTQLYQIIHVDGDRLRYEARTAVGDPFDLFELRKKPGFANELIERDQLTRSDVGNEQPSGWGLPLFAAAVTVVCVGIRRAIG